MNPKLNTATLDMVKHFEGLNLHVYTDIAGHKTIGYGHEILPTDSYTTLTLGEANDLLISDLALAQKYVNELVKVNLNDNEFGAIVDFVFNIGEKSFAASTLLKTINSEQHLEVPGEIVKWKNAAGKPNKGLLLRRLAEATLYIS